MSRTLFLLALLPLLAVAAPVPKPADKKLAEVYGEPTDPDGKCTFEVGKGGTLTVTVPAEHPKQFPFNLVSLPPLVGKTVEGDFVATVRVSHTLPAADKVAFDKSTPQAASAGLAVFAEKEGETKAAVSVGRGEVAEGWVGGMAAVGRWRTADGWQTAWAGATKNPAGGTQSGDNLDAKATAPVYVRITRKGKAVTREVSADGKKWQAMAGECEIDGPVRVGPVAFQYTAMGFSATFDEYELKQPKAEKK